MAADNSVPDDGGGCTRAAPAIHGGVKRNFMIQTEEVTEIPLRFYIIEAPWLVNGGHGASLNIIINRRSD
eukprot:COSAG01_NODE_724_length_14056_cov_41.795443_12_plen_70_part_00